MSQIGAPLAGSYDYSEVARSILIAIAASYAALDLGGRVTAARGWARTAWLTGGAIAMGIGIWAMHFKGMLAFLLPVTVEYHWPTILVSLVTAVLASAIALYVATRQKMGPVQAWTGSLIMGGGIAAMHYIGMAAMRLAAVTHFDPRLVALSIVLAILFSRIALMFTFDYREDFRGTTFAKVISAAVMGSAISLMHYTGMAAVKFMPAAAFPNMSDAVSISPLSNNGIAIVTFLALGTAILTSSVDRRTQVEILRLNERLEQRVVERTRQLTAANEELRREIAERQRAEQELRQAEERIRAILESSPNWIFLKDTEGRYLLVNREVERVFGMSQEEIKGKRDSEIFPPEHAAEYRANDLKVLREGLTMEFEEIALLEDGPHTSIVHKFPLFDTHGNIYATGGVATDITERKRAEEALRRSEERYRLIVENQTEFVVKWLPDGTRTFVNENYCRTFGIAEADCLGTSFYPLVEPEFREGIKRKVAALTPGEPEFTEEHLSLLPDGRHWQQWITRGIFDAGGNLIELVSAGRDINPLKRAEEDLRRLSGQLLQSQDEERRRIARDLHDSTGQNLVALATMLGRLRSSIPLTEQESGALLAESKALAEQSIREIRTLSYALHPPGLDEGGLEDAIHDYAKGFSERSGIRVELELSARLGRMARDIELAIFRVVQEGLTNIQLHSGSRQAMIKIERNSNLTVEISDGGNGILGDPQKGEDVSKFKVGVGIPSMQERVKLIGGQLEINSTSQGTTVRVTVPLRGGEREKTAHSGS
jgi:PAS domain S-box-containing protein